jgi:hypothetical protein
LHPSFARLWANMPGPRGREIPAARAASYLGVRALLHTPLAEHDLMRAVPEMEMH